MPCPTTRVLCVFHHSSMPQGSAPSPGPDLHHLPKREAYGLALLLDKFPRKTILTSPPHNSSFGSAAQQSHTTPPSPQCCPGWPQTPPGDPREILSSWEASSLPMYSSWRLQDCNKLQLPVQSSSPQSVHSNSQHCYIFSCFLHSLCRESQEGPEHAAFLSHTREHSERFTRREMK